jgi:hypothetical protein
MRVGCAALQQSKTLEESQQIGATTLQLIETLRTMQLPVGSAGDNRPPQSGHIDESGVFVPDALLVRTTLESE